MGEPTRFTGMGMGMGGAPIVEHDKTTIIEETLITAPVTTTTTTGASMVGAAPLLAATGLATPCHPVTGATNVMGAAPIGSTTTAFPGTTTIEQSTGLPSTTHMYGVPVATYEKHGAGKTGTAVPIATAGMGPIRNAAQSTYVETRTVPASALPLAPMSNTSVSDSFAPVNPLNAKGPIDAATMAGLGATALGAAGIHHHDRAHHHHVHDRFAPGLGTTGAGVAPLGTTGMAPGMTTMTPGMTTMAPGMTTMGPGMTTTGMAPLGTTGVAPLTGTTATGTKITGLNENQIIQDVIPPGRNRIVEHHEKY